jgi:hypothetical protein
VGKSADLSAPGKVGGERPKAFALLAPGSRPIAVVLDGPRQYEELGDVCTRWVELSAGSFREQGTNVNTAIVVLDG